MAAHVVPDKEISAMRHSLVALVFLCFAGSAGAQPVDWNVDMNHSEVGFTARHLGFSKVHGEFKTFTAKVKADAKTGQIVSFEATIEAKSVDTGIEKRDNHLRSDDFFAADKHPQITVKSKSIQWSGKTFKGVAVMTIRGIAKDVPFEGELLGVEAVDFGRGKHQRAGYEATAKINRKDFGLHFNGLAEGLSIAGDEVVIEITAETSYTPTK
jgi:polyisoprenoid-binding protein YceI